MGDALAVYLVWASAEDVYKRVAEGKKILQALNGVLRSALKNCSAEVTSSSFMSLLRHAPDAVRARTADEKAVYFAELAKIVKESLEVSRLCISRWSNIVG